MCLDYNCIVQKVIFLILPVSLLISGCGLNYSSSNLPTTTPYIITVTLPPAPNPSPTGVFGSPIPIPTTEPVEGITSTQVNVRGEPSTSSAPLGMLGPSTNVQIVGKDPSGYWAQIIFPQSPNGRGWLTLQYIKVKDINAIPVISIASNLEPGHNGIILQQVNIRSGPGTSFNAVGLLNPKDVVALTGKDSSGIWLQIQFTSGPDGRGWVTAAFVKASDVDTLPIVAQTGEVMGTETPTGVQPTITATVIVASSDNDSAQLPAVVITFSPTGSRSLIYTSDVSTPKGDTEDWIQFSPYTREVVASLTCQGNGKVNVELWQNGSVLQNWGHLDCGKTERINVSPGQPYLMHLIAKPHGNDLQDVHYTISIETEQ